MKHSEGTSVRQTCSPELVAKTPSNLLPLAALMLAGSIGAAQPALAQSEEKTLKTVTVKNTQDPNLTKESLLVKQTGIAKGNQQIKDIPQTVTVMTEKLMADQNYDDFREVLKSTAGVTFQAGETGEEDVRMRGFSLGQEATEHHQAAQKQLHDRLDISDWLTRSLRNGIDDHTSHLQNWLSILASIGSTSPFVGLFGTVWGIYHALVNIGTTGNVGIDAVAGPIGETLTMTALGLAVAIPAVVGYNALVRGNKFIIARMNRFAHDLHAYFVTGARVHSSAQGASHVV